MSLPLFENILSQPQALAAAAGYQLGEGAHALRASAELLKSSKKIVLTGMGASLFGAIPLSYALGARGVNAAAVETAELLHFLDATLDAETALVAVSRSGESVETLKLLDRIEGRGCKVIGVTNVPDSSLARRATACLLMNSPADQLVAIQTYIATVAVLALLGAAYLDELTAAAEEVPAVKAPLTDWIARCMSASPAWQGFVKQQDPLYILGRGAALASVQEGVLLMHETAKMAATGMSAAAFRHGPVEVVDAHVRAVVIGTQASTTKMDWELARNLQQMGATVRWIGPIPKNSGDGSVTPLCDWPEGVPARFSGVFEVTPLQLLAYRAAEARGFRPGDFRWASTVTSAESGFPGLQKG